MRILPTVVVVPMLAAAVQAQPQPPVSYTHLTLPTIYSV